MNLLRIVWLPILFIASFVASTIDSILDAVSNWFTWSNFLTLVVFAIMCLFLRMVIKANKKHHGQ